MLWVRLVVLGFGLGLVEMQILQMLLVHFVLHILYSLLVPGLFPPQANQPRHRQISKLNMMISHGAQNHRINIPKISQTIPKLANHMRNRHNNLRNHTLMVFRC